MDLPSRFLLDDFYRSCSALAGLSWWRAQESQPADNAVPVDPATLYGDGLAAEF